MKIVHTADWHIGKILNDYSLLDDQRYYFTEFIKKLDEIKPDALIIAGDLYDRSIPSAEAIQLLNDILCEIVLDLKIKTFIIAGNHDSKERLSFVGDLLSKSGLFIEGNITAQIKKVSIDHVNFYMMPYFEPHHIKQLYPNESFKIMSEAMKIYTKDMIDNIDQSKINILIGHGLFSYSNNNDDDEIDTSVGGSEMVNIASFDCFDYVALGHIHSKRAIGSHKMLYSGSPLKYSIDEASQNKCFIVADIEKDNISIEEYKIKPLHDVQIIEGKFDELINENINEDYVFIHLTDDIIILNAINRLKAVYPNILGLKYINIKLTSADKLARDVSSITSISNTDLFSEFYKLVTEQEINEKQKEYVDNIFTKLKGEQNDTDQT